MIGCFMNPLILQILVTPRTVRFLELFTSTKNSTTLITSMNFQSAGVYVLLRTLDCTEHKCQKMKKISYNSDEM